jgi:hypothetical protein
MEEEKRHDGRKISHQFVARESPRATEEHDVGEFFPNPSTIADNNSTCIHQEVALEMLPHSRYKLILIFLYLKVRSMQILWKNG